MTTPPLSAWGDGEVPLLPGGAVKQFPRIFAPAASHGLKEECCMRDPDEALVLQSQKGDIAAFSELIRKYQHMIHSLTFRMTGSMADAEDLAQETFINAYRQIDSYRGVSKFSTWLYRIAINACLSWRRREMRRKEATADWAESNAAQRDGTEDKTENCGIKGCMHEALLKLPAKQRAAVMLTLYDGLNHAEAAEALGCSETTVSWRIFAARRRLKKLLMMEDVRP